MQTIDDLVFECAKQLGIECSDQSVNFQIIAYYFEKCFDDGYELAKENNTGVVPYLQ